jgi:putative NADH-flavin reductase
MRNVFSLAELVLKGGLIVKIAIFGASGMIGQRIAREALARGYEVKALARNTDSFPVAHAQLSLAPVNIFDPASVAEEIADCEVVVNATSAKNNDKDTRDFFITSTESIVEGVKQAGGNKRLMVVGGAGSLVNESGQLYMDTGAIPDEWMAVPRAQAEQLQILRKSDVNWTFFSPSAIIRPGRRTGKYQLGNDKLLTNNQGESYISAEDYAVALVDEIDNRKFERRHFTAVSLEK